MYANLLNTLLSTPSHTVTIKPTSVSPTAIRQGLTRALQKFNKTMTDCGIPATTGKVTVIRDKSTNNITIKFKSPTDESEERFSIISTEE